MKFITGDIAYSAEAKAVLAFTAHYRFPERTANSEITSRNANYQQYMPCIAIS